MRKHPQIVIGVLLIALFICIAITAPLLAPNDPNATNLALKNVPPSAEYPLGCDQMGRCELSRLIYGARYSLSLTVPVLIVLAAIALFIGCYTSYKGGLIDEVIRLLCDIFMAFPLLVIAMSLVSVINNSVASIITAIGISMSAWFLRMARSYAKVECGKGYVESARVSGASAMRIVLHHIIPNVLPQFVVYFTTGIASAILSVSSFAFLGVGLIAGTPEWGAMLNDARNSIYTNPALIVYPGICLIICCAGFNLLGEGIRDFIGKEICYIMQNPMTAFNPSLRIGRQLEKTCYLHNPQISRQELHLLVSNTLQQLGLDDLKRILKSYPDALSGGMLQRIMIAAALINQPTILVADEATTAIDACNRIELMQLLRQLCSGGMAILFVTHDLRAASMADRILIMNNGQLVEAGTTEQIFNEPKEEYTKYLLSACTLERR